MGNMMSFLTFSSNQSLLSNSNGLVIGDSTIGVYSPFNDVKFYLDQNKPIDSLANITSIANSGDKIASQLAKYNLLTTEQKQSFDWVCIEIGINDIAQNYTFAQITTSFESLINQIKSDSKVGIKILAFTLTPCATSLSSKDPIYPDFQSFIIANSFNATLVSDTHTIALSDANGNLKPEYWYDEIHENNAGRNVIAVEWAKHLRYLGFNI